MKLSVQLNRFPQFLFARDPQEGGEYILHNRFPRFLAKVERQEPPAPDALGITQAQKAFHYTHSSGIALLDIQLLDKYSASSPPDLNLLQQTADTVVSLLQQADLTKKG